MEVLFSEKQFSSGEHDVQITERIYGDTATIHWNWFDENQRDIFKLLLKIDAIKRNYPNLIIEIDAPYIPYMRQDRLFKEGMSVPATVLLELLCDKVHIIKTMACHSQQANIENTKVFASHIYDYNKYFVFPDANAKNHYSYTPDDFIFNKVRNEAGVSLELIKQPKVVDPTITFIICDDICAGGRTFVECAKALRKQFGDDINIELLVYNAFLDFGMDALNEAGIQNIYIINKDSYDYVCALHPDYWHFHNPVFEPHEQCSEFLCKKDLV